MGKVRTFKATSGNRTVTVTVTLSTSSTSGRRFCQSTKRFSLSQVLFTSLSSNKRVNLAGIFWKREPEPPPPPGSDLTPPKPTSRTMSRMPEQPKLTPQFCFNQTALRGRLLLQTHPGHRSRSCKMARLPSSIPRRDRRHDLPEPQRPRHSRREAFRSVINDRATA